MRPAASTRSARPLIPIDPGWLFVLAGLIMAGAVILIPPQVQLSDMQAQLGRLEAEEAQTIDRLRAFSDFLATLEDEDPALTRRLAAAQLNLVRQGETPILMARSASAPVTDWIEATVEPRPLVTSDPPTSRLSRLVTGEHRAWALGAAILCLFVGLVLSGGAASQSRAEPRKQQDAPDPDAGTPRSRARSATADEAPDEGPIVLADACDGDDGSEVPDVRRCENG
jgi:hypothetical protein